MDQNAIDKSYELKHSKNKKRKNKIKTFCEVRVKENKNNRKIL